MQYKVSYNAIQKAVYIQEYDTPLKPDFSVLGLFNNDEISTENSDIFYTQAQRLLNENGITDMANIRILTDLAGVAVAKPYKVAPALAVFDQQGNIVGFHSRTGQLVPINELALKVTGEENGVGIVTIGANQYALLPVNGSGEVQANIAHRTGLLSSLLTLPGSNGEVGVATDTKSLVVFTGVAGQAIELRAIGRVNAAGTNSLTLGNNAMTSNVGVEAVALGANARGTIMGETAIGSSIPGVQRRLISLAYRTTDAEYTGLTTDGLASGSGNSPRLEKAGFYDVDVVLMGRQIGTNNFMRQHRRCVLRWGGGGTSPTKLFETSPTADVNTTLGAYGLSLGGVAGGYIDVSVEGLVGTTIQWAAYLDIRELSITV